MRSELNIAKEAAIEAGSVILNYYNADYEIQEKGYHNPVTTADYEADTRLKEILLNARPDYGWLSEETVDSRERLEKERVWVVDPLPTRVLFPVVHENPPFLQKANHNLVLHLVEFLLI